VPRKPNKRRKPKPPPPPRPTKAQVEQRVVEVLTIRLAGAQFWDVKELIRERESALVNEGEPPNPWQLAEGQKPLSDGQIWRYIRKADDAIVSSVRASRKKLLRLARARREYLYGLAVNQGDIRTALAVEDSKAKLCGLFDADLLIQLEELRKQLAQLKAERHGDGNAPAANPPAASGSSGTESTDAAGVG
jgi:hypothetical protein